MEITNKNIDSGKPFDWGKTSLDYARFRDIYPREFYQKIIDRRLCLSGQTILDVGTGTGVLPRNMYQYGAKWTATDISENQIEQAKILSTVMPKFYRMLKQEGRLLILYMAWLPFEDKTAKASEDLVLKYNPDWSGAGETVHHLPVKAGTEE